jgi:hypothetical protein
MQEKDGVEVEQHAIGQERNIAGDGRDAQSTHPPHPEGA